MLKQRCEQTLKEKEIVGSKVEQAEKKQKFK